MYDDDFLLLRAAQPSDFFDAAGRARVFLRKNTPLTTVEVYSNKRAPGPDAPPASVPKRFKWFPFHVPTPMLRTLAEEMEARFGKWYAFVRSHKHRFSCCNATVDRHADARKRNAVDPEFTTKKWLPRGFLDMDWLDEDFKRIYSLALLDDARHLGFGTPKIDEDGACFFLKEDSVLGDGRVGNVERGLRCLRNFLKHKNLFAGLQDIPNDAVMDEVEAWVRREPGIIIIGDEDDHS